MFSRAAKRKTNWSGWPRTWSCGQVKLWDFETGQERATFDVFAWPCGLAYNRDGTLLAVSTPPNIKVCNAATGAVEHELADDGLGRCNIAFSPDGKMLVKGCENAIHRWNCDDWSALEPLQPPGLDVRSDVVFSPDGHWLAADATFGSLTALAVAPGGDVLASAYADGNVRLWNIGKREIERSFQLTPGGNHIKHLAFSPEGRYLAAALSNGSIYLLRVGDATPASRPAARVPRREPPVCPLSSDDSPPEDMP